MSYEISIADSGQYIVCRIRAPITAQLAQDFSRDVDRLSRERGIKRLLFDVRQAPNMETVLGNYKFAYRDTQGLDLQKGVRSAILVSPSDRTHNFVETALANVGFNVRLFDDEDSAIKWLEEKKS